MAYDMKKDYESYMGGANDFAHARMAKKLVDQKRAARDAPPPMEGGGDTGGDMAAEEQGETTAPEAGMGDMPPSEPDGDEAMGGGDKIPVEVTAEELAMLEKMRAAKGGMGDSAPALGGMGDGE